MSIFSCFIFIPYFPLFLHSESSSGDPSVPPVDEVPNAENVDENNPGVDGETFMGFKQLPSQKYYILVCLILYLSFTIFVLVSKSL